MINKNEVRKIKINEIKRLKNLFKHKEFEKYSEELIKDIENNVRDIFVIIENEKFIGELTVYYKNKSELETISNIRVYLSAYRILKEYQGKGIGQRLLKAVIENLEKNGYTEFTIGVEDDNLKASHIYNKFGFNELLARLSETYEDNTYEYNLYLRKNINKKIEKLIKNNNLGKEILSISKITGGLSHRMYKVVTDKKVYAIKELNQGIMKRKTACENFVFSEKVTDIVIKNGIHAISAINVNNDIIKNIDNNYFMIFEWFDGEILNAEDISLLHCKAIGEILAQIHNIDFSEIEEDKRKRIDIKKFNWREYLKKAKKINRKYAQILNKNIDILYQLNQKSNEALLYANQNLIISHTDLDRKNVMWKNNVPYIIDWEASGYINPILELIQVAWYWSGGDIENIDYDKFKTVISTYKKYIKRNIDEDISKLIYADIYSGLEWLDYNFRRALCIGNLYDNDEIKLAENEIEQSINEIKYNVGQMDNMLNVIIKNL